MEEKSGCSFCGDRLFSGVGNYPLCKAMVDHDQQIIKARGSGEVGDKVAGDLLEGVRCVGSDWGEQRNGGVCIGLVLLACSTVFNVFPHKLGEAQPPEFRGDQLMCFKVPRVLSGLMIMTMGQDGVMEGVIRGNVDISFVCMYMRTWSSYFQSER